MIRFRTVKKALITWAAALLCATTASALSISMEYVDDPNTTDLVDLSPFMFTADAGGSYFEDYINKTGYWITDFHLVWTPASATAPTTNGGTLFGDSSSTTGGADFACGSCGTGIAEDTGFFISVSGFAPGTMFTATPTISAYCPPIPVPASLPLALGGLGLFGLIRQRRKPA